MTALLVGFKPTPIPGPRSSHGYQQIVKTGETIYGGSTVALDASTGQWARAVSTDATQIVYGRARMGDITTAFDTTTGAELLVDSGCTLYTFAAVATTDEGKVCYVVDDATATQTPGGPILGIIQLYFDATHAYVTVDPLINKALTLTSAGSAGANHKARVVAASVPVYTGSKTATLTVTATGALAAIDGPTPALNDVIFFEEGATNLTDPADAGPWFVSSPGAVGVSPVFIRPPWWAHGAPIVPAAIVEIGGDGTGTNPTLAGTTWKSFAAKGKIIGTDAPVFWPRVVSCAVTLASGTLAAPRTTIPVRSHLVTGFQISSDPATAPHANTRVWRVSALTPGVTGTSSVQIVAESAPGTTNASDVGQYNIVAANW